MFKSLFVILLFVASTLALEYSTVIGQDGQEYVLVPTHRVRRQTTFDVNSAGRATIGHTGTLLNNDRHHLTGTGFASRQFNPKGPLTTGGSLDYMHKPSGSTLGVGASNTRGFGTDFNAAGRYNFYNKGATSVFTEGQYGRHFGGPGGTGRPNYYIGAGIRHRF